MKVYKTMENDIQIIEYEDSIAGAVAEMWNQSNESWGGGSDITTIEHVLNRHKGGSYFNVYLAVRDGEVLGYCSFKRYYKDADALYVETLNVRPDCHGQKIGKALVLMCVERTIELGYPRLEIHTWPGNTKAVPLYKKCGYFWEDRTDSTHLSNFIPTVLSTELFMNYFAKADWYRDSVRQIIIKPDGAKKNKFELFQYSWEIDGERLEVGFEKTGRRINRIETDDYIVELTAENHELAFGLNYGCQFSVTNKSGNPLRIQINSKNDGNIKFNLNYDNTIADTAVINGTFYVGEVDEEQDIWRAHPCLMADVIINGRHAEMGLGIESKFPLTVNIEDEYSCARPGLIKDIYINIKSAFSQNVSVEFSLPENEYLRFYDAKFKINIEATANACIKTKAEVLRCGYVKLPVLYSVYMNNEVHTQVTRPLHVINQGISGAFSYEDNDNFTIANGPWRLHMYKKNNFSYVSNILGHPLLPSFNIAQLGKPYDDEFNIAKPADARMYRREDDMIMEIEFASEKHSGIFLTEVFSLSPNGTVSRLHRVKNISNQPKTLMLKDDLNSALSTNAVFCYDGGISKSTNGIIAGFSTADPGKFEENWVFEDNAACTRGMYWPPEYKHNLQWQSSLFFEHSTGCLKNGDIFETKPVISVHNLFRDYNSFRNYVLGISNRIPAFTVEPVDVSLNCNNPFISGETISLSVTNNRLQAIEGTITVNGSTTMALSNKTELSLITAEQKTSDGIGILNILQDCASYKTELKTAFFIPAGDVSQTEQNGIYTVSNGLITFKASPEYSHGVFSLITNNRQHEWLFSKYPSHEPYGWWNPFIGGIRIELPGMGSGLILKEEISTGFVTMPDFFGNRWSGIKTSFSIQKHDELRGLTVSQYFLTMSGIPVLCCFIEVKNNSGLFRKFDINSFYMLNDDNGFKDIYCATKSHDQMHNITLHMGSEETDVQVNKFIEVSAGHDEKMFIYKDMLRDNGANYLFGDNRAVQFDAISWVHVADNDTAVTRPCFIILTSEQLTQQALRDLERITFTGATE